MPHVQSITPAIGLTMKLSEFKLLPLVLVPELVMPSNSATEPPLLHPDK